MSIEKYGHFYNYIKCPKTHSIQRYIVVNHFFKVLSFFVANEYKKTKSLQYLRTISRTLLPCTQNSPWPICGKPKLLTILLRTYNYIIWWIKNFVNEHLKTTKSTFIFNYWECSKCSPIYTSLITHSLYWFFSHGESLTQWLYKYAYKKQKENVGRFLF